MLRPIASAFLLAVLALLALGRQSFPQSRGDKQAKAPMPAGAQAKTMALAARLAKPVTLDKAIDPNTPLKDALEFFSDRYKITILVNTQAFKADQVEGVEDLPVKLPKLNGVSLGTVLRLLAREVNGAYIVRSDHIEVTSRTQFYREFYSDHPRTIDGGSAGPQLNPAEDSDDNGPKLEWRAEYFPLVHAVFKERPLSEALRELAESAGRNVLLGAFPR